LLQALFCLILGNQVFARPQVNLVIDTGDSVKEVVRPEDKRRLLNEFQPIAILRQSLPKFQGIVLLIIKENEDGKSKFQNQCKY
jgi:hypothetical protein